MSTLYKILPLFRCGLFFILILTIITGCMPTREIDFDELKQNISDAHSGITNYTAIMTHRWNNTIYTADIDNNYALTNLKFRVDKEEERMDGHYIVDRPPDEMWGTFYSHYEYDLRIDEKERYEGAFKRQLEPDEWNQYDLIEIPLSVILYSNISKVEYKKPHYIIYNVLDSNSFSVLMNASPVMKFLIYSNPLSAVKKYSIKNWIDENSLLIEKTEAAISMEANQSEVWEHGDGIEATNVYLLLEIKDINKTVVPKIPREIKFSAKEKKGR